MKVKEGVLKIKKEIMYERTKKKKCCKRKRKEKRLERKKKPKKNFQRMNEIISILQ